MRGADQGQLSPGTVPAAEGPPRSEEGHRDGGGTILTAVSFMLKRGVDDHDLGPDHFQRTERTRLAARLARRLDELGFEATLAERAAA